ncbi:MAG: hypothetical protein HYZ60_02575, partial [Methylocystis sp.]|nr:hypothetical protein [Methylocystis sp.]
GAFIFVNVVFALLYSLGHESIAHARPGNILDLFFFSVETIGAVGYGEMHPQTAYGHVVATIEIFVGVCSLAVMAGLIFARFSRPRARLIFAQNPVIVSHDGAKTLMIRIANARHNSITNARAKLWIVRDERTTEGSVFRRFRQLDLARDENPVFALSWTIMHVIDEASPLYGWRAEDIASSDATFVITLDGLDETSSQFVHARQGYFAQEIVIDRDYVDIIQVDDSGMMKIDYTKFHDTKPAAGKPSP